MRMRNREQNSILLRYKSLSLLINTYNHWMRNKIRHFTYSTSVFIHAFISLLVVSFLVTSFARRTHLFLAVHLSTCNKFENMGTCSRHTLSVLWILCAFSLSGLNARDHWCFYALQVVKHEFTKFTFHITSTTRPQTSHTYIYKVICVVFAN